MKQMTFVPLAAGTAIKGITDQRVTDPGEVHTNLVTERMVGAQLYVRTRGGRLTAQHLGLRGTRPQSFDLARVDAHPDLS